MMIMKWWTVLGLALCVGAAACAADEGEDAQSSESQMRISNSTPTEGGACKITSGPNAGKTGTYDTTSDPGHTWCCTGANGSGSCTECSGSNKCTSAVTKWSPTYDFGGSLTTAP
jgi:hypothetical protein